MNATRQHWAKQRAQTPESYSQPTPLDSAIDDIIELHQQLDRLAAILHRALRNADETLIANYGTYRSRQDHSDYLAIIAALKDAGRPYPYPPISLNRIGGAA